MNRSTRFLLFVMVMFLTGCGSGKRAGTAEEGAKPRKSNTKLLVEGFTGKSAVERGKKARATVERVGAEQKRDLEEILE